MFSKLGLVLIWGLFCFSVATVAGTNGPAVDTTELEAFMAKWKANDSFFQYPNQPTDLPLILAALAKEPDVRWAGYLGRQLDQPVWALRDLHGAAREEAAAKIVPTLIEADRIITAAVKSNPTNYFDLAAQNIQLQECLNQLLLVSGSNYLHEAQAQARRILAHLQPTGAWAHDHKVYVANELLGHVALHEGKLADARNYLRAAGQLQLSPDTHGPDHQLAREVLNHGEPADREVVLAYLTDLINYYTQMKATQPLAKLVAESNLKTLIPDKEAIQAGQIPKNRQWY